MNLNNKNRKSKIFIYAVCIFTLVFVIGGVKLLNNKGTYSDGCSNCGNYPGSPNYNAQIKLDEWMGTIGEMRVCPIGVSNDYYIFLDYHFKADQCLIENIDYTNVYRCVACGGEFTQTCIDAISNVCGEGLFESDPNLTGGVNISEHLFTVDDIISKNSTNKPNSQGTDQYGRTLYGLGSVKRLNYSCDQVVVEEPVCNPVLVADGTEKTLVNTSTYYTFSGDSIKQTEVGTYTITAKLVDKKKYKWKNNNNTNDIVLNCAITVKPPIGITLVEEPKCKKNVLANGTEQILVTRTESYYTFSGDNIRQTNLGRYKIRVTLNDKTKYIWKSKGNTNDLELNCAITDKLSQQDDLDLEETSVIEEQTEHEDTTQNTTTNETNNHTDTVENTTTNETNNHSNITENPTTGSMYIMIVWLIGIVTIGYTYFYIKRMHFYN